MAERIRIEWTDRRGTDWRISILDDQFTGSYYEGQVLSDSVALTYEGAADETHLPLIGSSLTFELIRTGQQVDDLLLDIVTAVEGDIRAHLYRDGSREWAGVILPDTVSYSLDYLNGTATVTAVDDLGLLDQIEYQDTDGSALTTSERFIDHIRRCLSYLRTEGDWASSDEFIRVVDHVTAGTDSTYQPTALRTYGLRVHNDSFWTVEEGIYTFTPVRTVLEQILLILGARMFQAEGVWWIVPPLAYDLTTNLNYYSFKRDGTAYTASANFDTEVVINSGQSRLEEGWTTLFAPPMRSVYRSQNYGGNLYLMARDIEEGDFSTSLPAPNEFDYPVGSRFTVGGTLKIDLSNISTLTGPDRLVRFKLRVQVMIPGALVGGTRYFNAQAPDPTSIYQVENMTVNTGATAVTIGIFSPTPTEVGEWTTSSSGTGWEVWTPIMRANDASISVDSISFPFSFTTLPTLTDGQGLVVNVSLIGVTGYVGATGGSGSGFNQSLSGTYVGASDYQIEDFRVMFGDGAGEGNVIRYGSTVSSASKLREVLELEDSIIGDVVSDNSRGRIQVRIGTDWLTTTRWTSHLHTSGMPINRLLTRDRLALRQSPLLSIEGTIHQTAAISPIHSLSLSSDIYLITSLTSNLFAATSEVTAYRLQDNPDDIGGTSDDGDIQPVAGTKGDPAPDGDGILIAGKSAMSGYLTAVAPTTITDLQEQASTTASSLSSLSTVVSTNSTNIATNVSDISSLESSVQSLGNKLELIAGTFTAKGDDGSTTTVVKYEEDKTDGMSIELTQNLVEMTSGSGTSLLSISENSPGIFELELSDGATTPSAVPVLYATAGASSRYYVGIGTTSPSAIGLTVVGTTRTVGVVEVYDGGGKLYELPTTAGSDGQVLTRTGTSGTQWTDPSTGGGGDGWGIIAVSGQTSVTADQATDTLNLAEGSNLVITTTPATSTVTLAVSSSPTFSALTVNGAIFGTGALTVIGNISTLGSVTASGGLNGASGGVSGSWNVQGTFTANGAIIGSGGISFTGAGTSSIGIATGLPNQPNDLEIISNGNITLILDADTNETGQKFEVVDGNGTVIFSVDEDGISAGVLTTAAPTFSLASSYQQGSAQSITITNHAAGRNYSGAIYDSGGNEVTGSPLTFNGDQMTFSAPTTIATGYELRLRAITPGLLRSVETIETFEVTPSRTFTYWRFQVLHDGADPGSKYLMLNNLDLYTAANKGGTKYPTTSLTSATSDPNLTVTWGYSYSGREFWEAFDSNETGSDWWTISSPTGTDWGQLQFSSAITIASIEITVSGQFTNANQLKVLGSNTGAFSGEEIDCGTFTGVDAGTTTATYLINI